MSTHLLSISRTAEVGVYEVTVEIDGKQGSMRCRVTEHKGIRTVLPTPDLMWQLAFDARLLAAAVVAFHDAREADKEQS
jgi:hypothetical protein